MPVDCVAIRDASLTTRKRWQVALAAFRKTYNYPDGGAGYPYGFPVGNATWPEQFRNTVTADVNIDAKFGACLLGCNPNASTIIPSDQGEGYGFLPPSDINNSKGNS